MCGDLFTEQNGMSSLEVDCEVFSHCCGFTPRSSLKREQ